MKRGQGNFFVPGAHHDPVDANPVTIAGAAEPAGEPGQVLQFEREVLQDMSGPGAFAYPLQESAWLTNAATMLLQAGHAGNQPLIETGNPIRGVLFQIADVDPNFHHRVVGPLTGPTKVFDFKDVYRFIE